MIKKIDKNDEEEIRRDMESVRRGHNLSTIATEFLTQLVNPTKGKCVGIPTLIGGMPGRTNVFRLKQELRVVAGTNGYGFLALNYAMNGVGMTPTGPFSDTPVFCYTTAAYGTTTATGTVLKRRGIAVPAGCILAGWNLARYKFDDYTGDPDAMNSLQYRVSAAAAEVTNVTAVLEQNGTIVMWEPPNHGIVNATSDISLDTVMSEFTSRVISAQNGSNRNDKVVLNYHHKHLAAWPSV